MYKYGQYCPVAKAAEILGDRWTLLIVRDLLTGTRHFNEFERGLPGISRGLLAGRLRRLERMGVVKKFQRENNRQRTEYRLTAAGRALEPVIGALLEWGAQWAFGDPEPEDLDPLLLMWWMRSRVLVEQLPEQRVVVQFDFNGAASDTYWLVLTREDVSLCLIHPGFDIDVLVTADLSTFFQVWLGRTRLAEAKREGRVDIEAVPRLAKAFPSWFGYSPAAGAVRAVAGRRSGKKLMVELP
jgi:DNA-binding HxlR family transcriptional regulator